MTLVFCSSYDSCVIQAERIILFEQGYNNALIFKIWVRVKPGEYQNGRRPNLSLRNLEAGVKHVRNIALVFVGADGGAVSHIALPIGVKKPLTHISYNVKSV